MTGDKLKQALKKVAKDLALLPTAELEQLIASRRSSPFTTEFSRFLSTNDEDTADLEVAEGDFDLDTDKWMSTIESSNASVASNSSWRIDEVSTILRALARRAAYSAENAGVSLVKSRNKSQEENRK